MIQEIGQLDMAGILCRVCISPRRRRAAFSASENGLVLCGPSCMTLRDAEKILARNLPAAQRLLRKAQALPLPVPPPDFSVGGTLRMLGANCPVERGFGKPVFADGVFSVHPVHARPECFLKLYCQLALQILSAKVKTLAGTAGIEVAGVHISRAERRWGSCTAQGHIHFAWKLILCPEKVVDYVVAHELAHRRHMDHSADFWEEVERLCPEWELRRKELRLEEQKLRSWSEFR